MPSPSHVVVYIPTTDSKGPRAEKLKEMFDNHLFKIRLITVQTDGAVTPEKKEIDDFEAVLEDAGKRHKDDYIAFVKDTSTTALSPDDLADRVKKIIHRGGWDIFYLCVWKDDCPGRTDHQDLGGISIARTQSPHGVQAIILSPAARKMLSRERNLHNGKTFQYNASLEKSLNDSVRDKALVAFLLKVNLINYDIAYANGPADYQKTHQCADRDNNFQAPPTSLTPLQPGQGSDWGNAWIWILAIIVVIIIIAIGYWALNKKKVVPIQTVPQITAPQSILPAQM